MVNLLKLLALTYLAAVIETALAPVLTIYDVAPSLLAILAIAWVAQNTPSPWRVPQAAAVGLMLDFSAGGHAGIGMAALSLAAIVVLQMRVEFRRLGPIEQAIACAPLVMIVMLLIALGNRLFGQLLPPPAIVLVRCVAAGVYTAALSLPIWMVLAWSREPHGAASRPLHS